MRVVIVGAGAIGILIGTLLARRGCTVSAVARGATAAALERAGMRLEIDGETVAAPVRVSAEPAALGPQDLVIVSVKAPSLGAAARTMAPLIGRDTTVLTAMNGVPWWFFHGFGGAYEGAALASVDPGGGIAAAIPARHIVGGVVHCTSTIVAPGLARHGIGKRVIIGEPAGGVSDRVGALTGLFTDAGFEASSSPAIQADIWYKLWGNMTMNPISALTGATADRILDDPLVERFIVAAMAEAAAIGARIGCVITESSAERNAVTRSHGAFKTSMLQDLEAGRPLEIDALVTVVHEIGGMVGLATPAIDALLGLVRLAARQRGLYRGALA